MDEQKIENTSSDVITIANQLDFDLNKVRITEQATTKNIKDGDKLVRINNVINARDIVEIFVRHGAILCGKDVIGEFEIDPEFLRELYHFDPTTLKRRGLV